LLLANNSSGLSVKSDLSFITLAILYFGEYLYIIRQAYLKIFYIHFIYVCWLDRYHTDFSFFLLFSNFRELEKLVVFWKSH